MLDARSSMLDPLPASSIQHRASSIQPHGMNGYKIFCNRSGIAARISTDK
ncbi:MAG: hypothetical protein AB1797_13940 [bacterium]